VSVEVIVNGVEIYPVTDDPEQLAALEERDREGAGSKELGIFAAEELGIRPPRLDGANRIPDIVQIWPPDAEEGIWAWGLHEAPEADPEEGRPEADAPPSL
jgi:hypothetical protein